MCFEAQGVIKENKNNYVHPSSAKFLGPSDDKCVILIPQEYVMSYCVYIYNIEKVKNYSSPLQKKQHSNVISVLNKNIFSLEISLEMGRLYKVIISTQCLY